MARRRRKNNSSPFNKTLSIIIFAIILGFAIYAGMKFGQSHINNKAVTAYSDKTKLEPEIKEQVKPETQPEQGKEEKKTETQPEENKVNQAPPAEQPIKANEKYVDPVLENFLNIYVNLASDNELEFYYLDNVVVKNSSFYKLLMAEILQLRQAEGKYSLDDFAISKIDKGTTENELLVQVTQVINQKTHSYIYTIYFDKQGVFIKDRK